MNSARLPLTLFVALFLGLVLEGCALLKNLEDLPRPKLSFQNVKIQDLDWKAVDMVANFRLTNPYPIGLQVERFNWDLAVEGKPFLDGAQNKATKVAANKGGTVALPFTVKFDNLLKFVQSAKGKKEVPFELTGKMAVNTPVGPVSLPLRAKGNLPVLRAPKVKLTSVSAGMKGLTTLLFKVGMQVEHDNAYALDLASLVYDLKIEGAKVASGKASKGKTISAGKSATVDLPIEVDLASAGQAVMSAITSGKIDYALGTDLNLETPFGVAPLDFSDSGSVRIY